MASEMLPMCKSVGKVPDVCYQLKPGYSVRAIGVIISFVNLKQHIVSIFYTRLIQKNYRSFDFFNLKFDHSSYSKNYANIVKFKLFLNNFY